jgi:hypothetical protein
MTYSSPYHHQGNERAERTVRKVLETARTLMIEANAPHSLTDKYIEMAVWLLNRTPNSKLADKTPFEAVTGMKPDLSYCVPVNSKGYAFVSHEEQPKRHKMDKVAEEVTIIGYSDDDLGTYIVRTKDGRILYRRDVRFDEFVEECETKDSQVDDYSEEQFYKLWSEQAGDEEDYDDDGDGAADDEDVIEQDVPSDDDTVELTADDHRDSDDDKPVKKNNSSMKIHNRMPLRSDVVMQFATNNHITATDETPYTPSTVYEALDPKNPWRVYWLKAINEEMEEMFGREVFEEIDQQLHPDKVKKAFRSKFAFRVKNEGGGVIKFKARLVVKGFSQKYGIDYDETFAPTINFGAILTVLHIAVTNRWVITGCDIGNAYLEALTNRELYMKLPSDWCGKDENGVQRSVVVRLLRNLYGSKQAALLWYNHLCYVLKQFGFQRLVHEPCCFKVEKESGVLIVCVYVDDLLITGSSTTVVAEFKKHLSDNFEKIKDLDDMPRYLGLSVTRMDNGQIALSQEEYVDELLEKYGLTERSPYNTPLPTDLEKYMEPGDGSVPPVMDVVGQLRYLADRTRPNIGYATSFLARQKLAMRVLR